MGSLALTYKVWGERGVQGLQAGLGFALWPLLGAGWVQLERGPRERGVAAARVSQSWLPAGLTALNPTPPANPPPPSLQDQYRTPFQPVMPGNVMVPYMWAVAAAAAAVGGLMLAVHVGRAMAHCGCCCCWRLRGDGAINAAWGWLQERQLPLPLGSCRRG